MLDGHVAEMNSDERKPRAGRKQKTEPAGGEEGRYNKRKEMLEQLVDMGVIADARQGDATVDRVMGVDTDYTPAKLQIAVEKYFDMVDHKVQLHISASGVALPLVNKFPYTLEGLCVYLGIGMKKWRMYAKDPAFAQYHDVCDMAETKINDKILSGALVKDYDSSMSKFYMKNRSEMTEDGENNEAIRQKIGRITFVTVKKPEDLKLANVVDVEAIDEGT